MEEKGQCATIPTRDLRLEDMIGFQLRCAQIAVFRDILAAFDGIAVTVAQFSALKVIADSPGVSQAELAAAIEVDRPRIVPLLDAMEERGWTVRETSTQDRRIRRVYPTREGQVILRELTARFALHQQRMVERLGDIDTAVFIEGLQRLAGRGDSIDSE